VKLSTILAKEFEHGDRKRGLSYANSRVRVTSVDPHSLIAEVEGSYDSEYEVILKFNPEVNTLSASCTCMRYSNGYNCKHLWATLVCCDRQGIGLGVLSHRINTNFDDPQELSYQVYQSINGAPANSFQETDELPRFDWRTGLSQVRTVKSSSSMMPGNAIDVHYMIDAAQCIHEESISVQLHQSQWNQDPLELEILNKSLSELQYQVPPSDWEMIQTLRMGGVSDDNSYEARFQNYRPFTSVTLHPLTYSSVLSQLATKERLWWKLDQDQQPYEASRVTWDDRGQYQLQVEVLEVPDEEEWCLTGTLVRGDEQRTFGADVVFVLEGIALFQDGTLSQVRQGEAQEKGWLQLFSKQPQVKIPFEDKAAFLTMLYQSEYDQIVELPESLLTQPVEVSPVPKFYIDTQQFTRGYYEGHIKYCYEDIECDDISSQRRLFSKDFDICIDRNFEEEEQHRKTMRETEAEASYLTNREKWRLPHKKFNDIVNTLLDAGWKIVVEGKDLKSSSIASINVKSNIDWFDLEADFDFDGQTVALPQLLKAAKAGERWIELGDGSHGLLPSQWFEKHGHALGFGESSDDSVRFRPTQAMVIDSILSAQPSATMDRGYKMLLKKLSNISGIKPRKELKTFKGELRDYQRDGLGWLRFLNGLQFGGCLADDMGLGKTIQILAMLEERRRRKLKDGETRKPTIIVVPKSLVFNWQEEAERFTPNLKVASYTGRERNELHDSILDYHVIVTTYGTLRKDIEFLSKIEFDYAILDEAQAIKNHNSLAAKACRIIKADHRLAATGTPIENNLGELWSLFEFLNPGMLGRSTLFRSAVKNAQEEPEKLNTLAKAIAPYVLRRTKQEVLTELPDKTEHTLHCELTKKQRKQYDELRTHYHTMLNSKIEKDGLNKSKIHVLEALLRLRQAACHPGLIDKKRVNESSAKVDLLVEQMEDVVAGGHKALIFSQFTSLLSIVKSRFDKKKIVYEYLDGKTSKRKEKVDRFQTDDDCSAFLISLKAGGTGLNLTSADYVYILDPWWNPAAEAQAVDRAHRIGQTKNVVAYRIIAKDTIEEKVAELQSQKKALADAIITANDNLLKSLTADDLQLLLG